MNIPNIELTEDFVLSQIKDVRYFYDNTLTICVITTLSNFKIIGSSYVFDEKKYNQIKGMEVARQKATSQLFEHVAFYLKAISNN